MILVCEGESLGRKISLLLDRGAKHPFVVAQTNQNTPDNAASHASYYCYEDMKEALQKIMTYEGLHMKSAL